MPVIFSDLSPDEVVMCFDDILSFMETEWGNWHLPGRILYDDPVSLEIKAQLVLQAGMLGVNMFDIHGDTDEWDLTD